MVAVGKFGIYRQTIKVVKAVKLDEGMINPSVIRTRKNPERWVVFNSNGPRLPTYSAVPPRIFLNVFNKMSFPKKSAFCDLGAGKGLACFIASFYVSSAIGYEIDPELHGKAEFLREKLGLKNVGFINKDFLAADLKPYNILFMHRPFEENLVELMSNKLKETKSGTFIISYRFDKEIENIFDPKDYTEQYPGLWKYVPQPLLPTIFVFKRK